MKTVHELFEEIKAEGVPEDKIREEHTKRMKSLIETKLKLQGPPPPQLIAGINTQHIIELFRFVIDLVMATSTEDQYDQVWEEFNKYREWDITARHYDAYVQTQGES